MNKFTVEDPYDLDISKLTLRDAYELKGRLIDKIEFLEKQDKVQILDCEIDFEQVHVAPKDYDGLISRLVKSIEQNRAKNEDISRIRIIPKAVTKIDFDQKIKEQQEYDS
ncbi:hypothetical protein EXE10_17250 [Acinetobacter sp. WCHAc060033]|uniref:hypothetical protein n=1 Tax=Acinetobacter sp. WCHAc060033 TaxID=2518624 RepID=UPI00102333C3|nr:hypothetical protein [Acinetobacter sp. WCHAc060033]RZG78716.1 hypothetical protein EXE10_17250 [Acinetobacter sp. WCHAc060033]